MRLLPLALALLMPGCATYRVSLADLGQGADCATTAVAFSKGYDEANPVWGNAGIETICAVKLGVSQATKTLPEPACIGGQMGLSVGGFGAAIWNAGVVLGAGFYALPVIAAVVIIGWDAFFDDAHKTCKETP